jgi:hypothetical protein
VVNRNFHLDKKEDVLNARKSRPVFGAFALYPGFFNQVNGQDQNPYQEIIKEISIGAFPLLPCPNNTGSTWLKTFLCEKLARRSEYKYPKGTSSTDQYYVEEAARIPYYGMKQVRYDDLTLVATSAQDQRNVGYYESFENGNARWFHMKLAATDRQRMTKNAILEVRHCIIAAAQPNQVRKAYYNWPVLSVVLKNRANLSEEQTGLPSKEGDEYWLFELGKPIKLNKGIVAPDDQHHHTHLVEASTMGEKTSFKALEDITVYLELKAIELVQ